jgi:hypothetical protein
MDLNLEPVPENPVRQKQIAVALAAIAVVALVFGCVSRRWMAADGIDAGYGPRGWQCTGDECGPFEGSLGNGRIVDLIQEAYKAYGMSGGPSKLFPIVGWITVGATAIAVIALILAAVQAWGAGVQTRPISPTTVALLTLLIALIAACIFVATNPFRAKGLSQVGVSWPFFVYGAGVVLGITAAQKLIKFKRVEPGELSLY